LCSERGEYHTFVIDELTFKMRIKVSKAKRVTGRIGSLR